MAIFRSANIKQLQLVLSKESPWHFKHLKEKYFYYIPINYTPLELHVFWASDTECCIKLRFSEYVSLSLKHGLWRFNTCHQKCQTHPITKLCVKNGISLEEKVYYTNYQFNNLIWCFVSHLVYIPDLSHHTQCSVSLT